jgi:hypothetical protein
MLTPLYSADSPYAVASIDSVPTLPHNQPNGDPDCPDWKPMRHLMGGRAFGYNVWVSHEAGEVAIFGHTEHVWDHLTDDERERRESEDVEVVMAEELYVVLRGAARFTLGHATDASKRDDVDAPPGTMVLVAPSSWREAVALEDETMILAVGAPLGKAFHPHDWEQQWFEIYPDGPFSDWVEGFTNPRIKGERTKQPI